MKLIQLVSSAADLRHFGKDPNPRILTTFFRSHKDVMHKTVGIKVFLTIFA